MIRYLREFRLRSSLERRRGQYLEPLSEADRLAWQLTRFNEQWGTIRQRVPYWRERAASESLPQRFASWEEVINLIPAVTKEQVRAHVLEMANPSRPADFTRTTGGSAAQPVSLPAWNSENLQTIPDVWLARSWYGIRPSSRLFIIWGHGHLHGTGLKGTIKEAMRHLKDRLLGYCRVSAYDLSEGFLADAARRLLAFRPEYVIGYSTGLDAFVRANRDYAEQVRALRLKAVIATAESFPHAESRALVGEFFGCPVAMEYGAIETHVMAHTHPEGGYRAFWRNYFLDAVEAGPSGGRLIRVTSLYPRCFPLIRYDLTDEITLPAEESGVGLTRLEGIAGRASAFITLPTGESVHSSVFDHVIKTLEFVARYQVVQEGEAVIFTIVLDPRYRQAERGEMERRTRQTLALKNPALERVPIRFVEDVERTIAGKSPLVIRRNAG